jgi:AcrR family transcriptional regulator
MDQDSKQQLLDLIEDILITRGYRNTTMDDIAVAAKMSKKTLYVIFNSKENMTAQVVDRLFTRVENEIDRLAAIPDPLERFRKQEALVVATINPIERQGFISRPFFWKRAEKFRKKRFQEMIDLFTEAQQQGILKADFRPDIVALMFNACIRSLHDPDTRIQYGFTAQAAVDHVVDIFLEGLKA